MKRYILKKICKEIAQELKAWPYQKWKEISFPYSYIDKREEGEVDVELCLLEDKPGYMNVSILLTHLHWLGQYFPVGTNIIIEKPEV